MEYLKNTNTGRVFEANEHMKDYARNQGHLVPCDEKGNKLMDDSVPDETLKAEIEQLKQENYDLKTELALYRQRDNQEAKESEPAAQGVPNEPNRMEVIVNAVGSLEQDNPDHFVPTGKRAGKPRVETLKAFSGLDDVSADEADAAWERFQG